MLMYFFIHWSWLVIIVVVVFDVVNLAQAWVIWEKEFPLLRKSLHKTGLWVSLWGVSWFMVAMGRPGQHIVGVATPGQVVWSVSGSGMRQAMRSKPASSAAPTSWLQTPPSWVSALTFFDDGLWCETEINPSFPSSFWSWSLLPAIETELRQPFSVGRHLHGFCPWLSVNTAAMSTDEQVSAVLTWNPPG